MHIFRMVFFFTVPNDNINIAVPNDNVKIAVVWQLLVEKEGQIII